MTKSQSMKKLIIALAALTLLCAPAGAQGFLNKLKEKASEAVGNVVSGAIGEKIQDAIPESLKGAASQAEAPTAVTGEQALPPRRESTFGWDGPVTPSSASFPIPLMNEFPAVPAAASLANPVETEQIAYYKAIKAVTLRAEELNADTTCDDDMTRLWREKSDKMLRQIFGLTEAEIRELEDENLPEAERQRLEEKMAKALLGDIDVDAIEKQAAELEGKNAQEVADAMTDKGLAATFAVYDRNAADIEKYCGVTAADFKNAARAQRNSPNPDKTCPEMEALNARMKAYQKEQAAKDPSFKKEADAFEKKMQKESLKAVMSGTGLGAFGGVAQAAAKAAPIVEMEQKLAQYFADVTKLIVVPDTGADAKFSAADRKKVLALKEQIYATDDPFVYNPLYLQALELIKTYRERAAAVWAADVQKRFNTMKDNMSALIKLNRQAVADEIIPDCALWRIPLNLVIIAGDVLAEAYSEFPCDYPPMYSEEVIREVSLANVPGSQAIGWFPEFSVFGPAHFDAIVGGKYIFASNAAGEVYQFNAGQWTLLTKERVKELNEMKKTVTPASQTWTSRDGKRTVVFNAEGGFFQFPEGNVVLPDSWKATESQIQWVQFRTPLLGESAGKYQIVLCTYKL